MGNRVASGLAVSLAASLYAAPHSQVHDIKEIVARQDYVEDPLHLHGTVRLRDYILVSESGPNKLITFIVKKSDEPSGGIENIILREVIPTETGGFAVLEFTDNPENEKYGSLDKVEIGALSKGRYFPVMTNVDLSQSNYLERFQEILNDIIFKIWANNSNGLRG